MRISVLGSGCATCEKLYRTVLKVVKEHKIDADVEYSKDVSRIIELGLMQSPVLVIDGRPLNVRPYTEKDLVKILSNGSD